MPLVSLLEIGLALEVENMDEFYQHVREKKLPIKAELNNFNWGQRGFAVFEPNGLVVLVYSRIRTISFLNLDSRSRVHPLGSRWHWGECIRGKSIVPTINVWRSHS